MQNNHPRLETSLQDSIYRLWKFKKIELPQNFGGAMGIDKYDLWDLRQKDVLNYSVTDSPGVFHAIPYKMINKAIVLQFPDKQNNVDVQFKIKELTATTLKVIMHVRFNQEGKILDKDVVQLDFKVED
jgi:hypothetical protein